MFKTTLTKNIKEKLAYGYEYQAENRKRERETVRLIQIDAEDWGGGVKASQV